MHPLSHNPCNEISILRSCRNYFQILHTLFIFFVLIVFHFANLSSLFPCLLPTGKVLVHQCMETGIVAGFQKMAQFMHHHMLEVPTHAHRRSSRCASTACWFFCMLPVSPCSVLLLASAYHVLWHSFHKRFHIVDGYCYQTSPCFLCRPCNMRGNEGILTLQQGIVCPWRFLTKQRRTCCGWAAS